VARATALRLSPDDPQPRSDIATQYTTRTKGIRCSQVGRSTRCLERVYAWLRRYAEDGMPGLVDRSRRPDHCPHQTPAELDVGVIAMRREHPAWGPRR
jgi:hypothetical protein